LMAPATPQYEGRARWVARKKMHRFSPFLALGGVRDDGRGDFHDRFKPL
jgi:hypothetical protein